MGEAGPMAIFPPIGRCRLLALVITLTASVSAARMLVGGADPSVFPVRSGAATIVVALFPLASTHVVLSLDKC